MLRLMRQKRNSSGVIMIIVVVIIMVLAIISATIISQSMSEAKSSRNQANQIVLEELASGAFWGVYNKRLQLEGSAFSYPVTYTSSQTIHGRSYTATAKLCNPGNVTTSTPAEYYDPAANSGAGACVVGSGPNVWVNIS